jgi:hypothetical protein
MELIFATITIVCVLSLIGNLKWWRGRGGGRIRIGGSWVQFSRRELRELFQHEMTAEESATFHTALRMGDIVQAEAILADVAIRYLQRKPQK